MIGNELATAWRNTIDHKHFELITNNVRFLCQANFLLLLRQIVSSLKIFLPEQIIFQVILCKHYLNIDHISLLYQQSMSTSKIIEKLTMSTYKNTWIQTKSFLEYQTGNSRMAFVLTTPQTHGCHLFHESISSRLTGFLAI